jgi:hypothetical protein
VHILGNASEQGNIIAEQQQKVKHSPRKSSEKQSRVPPANSRGKLVREATQNAKSDQSSLQTMHWPDLFWTPKETDYCS